MREPLTLRLHTLMLCMPDSESLSQLEALAVKQPWMQAGLHELLQTPLSLWQDEYTRLFVSGSPSPPAPPYESAYCQQNAFGPVVDALNELYRKAGLNPGQMPVDYLGTQLEFAACLAESRDPDARLWLAQLWRDHMQHWLPRFIADLCQNSRLLIYRLWGGQLTLLSTFMNGELAHA
jgi:putative dimethyl sulfoxide reductase chaperone